MFFPYFWSQEEELRKEGGKYAHLNEDLHVLVECFAEATDGYHRVAAALVEVRKFLIPVSSGENTAFSLTKHLLSVWKCFHSKFYHALMACLSNVF